MGSGKVYKCKECGNRFRMSTGVGMLYPMSYENTVKDILSGKYGEEWKQFLEEHQDGRVNCEIVLLICEKCGVPKCDMDLSLYLPRKGKKGVAYPFSVHFKESYKLYARYPHTCDCCGGACKVCDKERPPVMKCKECSGVLEDTWEFILWD
ncbi:MAG: hypothetical protein J5379_04355 [Clostridiales bacterium]|nr:hypothetical protein [Clostridiales bacterium]